MRPFLQYFFCTSLQIWATVGSEEPRQHPISHEDALPPDSISCRPRSVEAGRNRACLSTKTHAHGIGVWWAATPQLRYPVGGLGRAWKKRCKGHTTCGHSDVFPPIPCGEGLFVFTCILLNISSSCQTNTSYFGNSKLKVELHHFTSTYSWHCLRAQRTTHWSHQAS